MDPVLFDNDEAGRESFVKLASRAVEWIATYYKDVETFPVKSQSRPGDVYSRFPNRPPTHPVSTDEVFRMLNEVILPGMTHWQHPQFFAFFPGNTSFPSIAAELITSGMAAQCMMWESSPAAAELEQRVMEWCRDLLGLPLSWHGVIQDTASTATLTALITAREWHSGFSISKRGFDGTTYRIYASAQAHSSVEKAVRLAGFGTDNLVHVPVDHTLSMIPQKLSEAIQQDLDKGYTPVCVISTIGTTGIGAIDPIAEINHIAKVFGLWHHVDAAYAGTALMLDEYAHLRSGLEEADSFVFNPHKWMFVQFDCSAYYVRDPKLLIKTMRITPSYLESSQGEEVHDYRDWGIPLGRRFRALKLWMTLQLLGTDAIKGRLRHHIELARKVEELVSGDMRLELAYPRSLNIVTFRIRAEYDADGQRTRQLSLEINTSGLAYMTHAVIEGRSLIRWVTGQTYTKEIHIENTWSLIQSRMEKIFAV